LLRERAEVPLVERQHLERLVPAREHDDRRARKTGVEIGEASMTSCAVATSPASKGSRR
jgi:hypothetical protein